MADAIYGETVSTRPVKKFFVEMLTRDIALEDAILDLLDNCIDGVQRSVTTKLRNTPDPYKGYRADIVITEQSFSITDNCGGIPWSEHERAFRMGNPSSANPKKLPEGALMVGVYGIGMKRAIFKMGYEATISTKTSTESYDVVIPKGWADQENEWDLNVTKPKKNLKDFGTAITVSSLNKGTVERFRSDSFFETILDKIETHYSVIITKGFQVTVNGRKAVPKKVSVKFAEPKGKDAAVRPYIFKSTLDDGVEIFVAVGLREAIPDAETILLEQDSPTHSTDNAGWTIICNDRVVLYCNRDELTGWGTADIPRYHTQFIAISGFVEFKGDPSKLPTTTTKRGLEFSASLYQQVLNRMREGTRLFVDYTNWWKQNEEQAKQQVIGLPSKSLAQLKSASTLSTLTFNVTKTGLKGEIYKPILPKPTKENLEVRIAFSRPKKDVFALAEEVFELDGSNEKKIPNWLGEHLFDEAFAELKKGRK